jgi:hypothetical protein
VSAARRPLAPWTYPFLIVLAGLALWAGRLPVAAAAAVAVEMTAVLAYLVLFTRRPPHRVAPSPILGLLPGHLLVLFALTLVVPGGGPWVYLWLAVPALSVVYDAASRWPLPDRIALSISLLAYAILWASLVTLLERIIVLGRGLEGRTEVLVAAVLGGAGAGFIALGIYRHRRAWTADKE